MEKVLARTTEEGSRQIVWAAVANEDKKDELQGAYITLSEISEPSNFVISEEGKHAQDRLWVSFDLSPIAELCGVTDKFIIIGQSYRGIDED